MPTLIDGFIKGVTGNNSSDGLSRATAKKTLANLVSTYSPTGGNVFLEEAMTEAFTNAVMTGETVQPYPGGTAFDWSRATDLSFVLSAGNT